MPKRLYREFADPESGLRFRFAYETGVNGPLHVEARHTLYWAWHASEAVLVITCFRRGDLEWKES